MHKNLLTQPVPALRCGGRLHRAHAAFRTGFLDARRAGVRDGRRFFRHGGRFGDQEEIRRFPFVVARHLLMREGTMVMFLHCLSFTLCATLATRVQPACSEGCLKRVGGDTYVTFALRRVTENMTTGML